MVTGLAASACLAAGLATPAGAAPMTTITFTVTGCEGCTIGVQRALAPGSHVRPTRPAYWSGPSGIVAGGKVQLRVPTARTSGMSFTINAPWQGEFGAVANVVLGAGGRGGAQVSERAARQRKRATACWAGTDASAADITVLVVPVTLEGYDGPVDAPLAWASPAVATVGPLTDTYRGTLGNQDAFYC